MPRYILEEEWRNRWSEIEPELKAIGRKKGEVPFDKRTISRIQKGEPINATTLRPIKEHAPSIGAGFKEVPSGNDTGIKNKSK